MNFEDNPIEQAIPEESTPEASYSIGELLQIAIETWHNIPPSEEDDRDFYGDIVKVLLYLFIQEQIDELRINAQRKKVAKNVADMMFTERRFREVVQRNDCRACLAALGDVLDENGIDKTILNPDHEFRRILTKELQERMRQRAQ